jgi:hypothetical protein
MGYELTNNDVRVLRAAALCASSDAGRPLIASVHLEGAKAPGFDAPGVAVATDSYRMGWGPLSFAPESCTLAAADLVRALKAWKAPKRGTGSLDEDGSGLVLDVDGRRFSVAYPAGDVVWGEVVEGDFPEWRKLVPVSWPVMVDQFGEFVAAFNASFLADLAKISKTLELDAVTVPVRVSVSDRSRPALFAFAHRFSYLLMPVRVSS